jgi:transketolase
VGVAEANMMDIAAGMATTGLRPVVNTFSLFLMLKGADQLRNTICYNNLPVVLGASYGGLSDSYDGASHQAILDVAMARVLPNMAVVVPGDAVEVKQALRAALRRDGPTFIRLSRNETPVLFADAAPLELGKIRKLRDGGDVTIAASGVPVAMAIEAAARLAAAGISADVLEVSTLKPLDVDALVASAAKTGRVLTVEEHTVHGGLYGAVAEALGKHHAVPMDAVAIADRFTESGDYSALLMKYGIHPGAIEEKAKGLVAQKNTAR